MKANFRFLLSLSQATALLRLWDTEFLKLPCGGGGELVSDTWRNYGKQTKDSEVEFVFLGFKKVVTSISSLNYSLFGLLVILSLC